MAAGWGVSLEKTGPGLNQESGWAYSTDRIIRIYDYRSDYLTALVHGLYIPAVSNHQEF
jgi:hypothetical protein